MRTPLPTPRGPASTALLTLLATAPPDPLASPARTPTVDGLVAEFDRALERVPAATGDLLSDDDLQLTLYCRYALHLHGLPGVDDRWEWHPALTGGTARLEAAFERALRDATADLIAATLPDTDTDTDTNTNTVTKTDTGTGAGADTGADTGIAGGPTGPAELLRRLVALTNADLGPSLSRHIARRATAEQFADFLRARSVYQLKEADPHTLAIPRLRGRAKSALVEIQADEYGNGIPARMHSSLFADTLRAVGLDDTLGSHVDDVPAIVLAADNAAMLFGLHRRLRGAAVGHLAALELTSSLPMRQYARGADRLGFGEPGRAYFAEHVEVDAVHEQVAMHDMVVPLVAGEPELADDVLLGAAACLWLDAAVTSRLFAGWGVAGAPAQRPSAPTRLGATA